MEECPLVAGRGGARLKLLFCTPAVDFSDNGLICRLFDRLLGF